MFVEYQIMNESNFPLTMKASFRFFGNLANAVTVFTGQVPLFPRRPHKISVELPLLEKQSEEYLGLG